MSQVTFVIGSGSSCSQRVVRVAPSWSYGQARKHELELARPRGERRGAAGSPRAGALHRDRRQGAVRRAGRRAARGSSASRSRPRPGSAARSPARGRGRAGPSPVASRPSSSIALLPAEQRQDQRLHDAQRAVSSRARRPTTRGSARPGTCQRRERRGLVDVAAEVRRSSSTFSGASAKSRSAGAS